MAVWVGVGPSAFGCCKVVHRGRRCRRRTPPALSTAGRRSSCHHWWAESNRHTSPDGSRLEVPPVSFSEG
ncbi:hypothetical protein ISCGN_010220 [Ixodes scapularis]